MNIQIENLGSTEHLQGGLEVSYVELKKQTEQAKRFGNADIKNHPQLGNIKEAMKVLQPGQLLNVLKNTRSAMSGRGGTADVDKQDIPHLLAPRSNSTGTPENAGEAGYPSAAAEMTALLGKISQLTTDSSLQNQLSRLQGFNAMMSGASDAYSSMAKALEQQGAEWASSSDAVKAAQKQAAELAQNVSKAESDLTDAQNILNDLEAGAANQNPVSPELQSKIDAAKAAVVAAQSNLTQATTTYNHFVNTILNPAIAAEKSARLALSETQNQAKEMVTSFTPQQNSAIEQRRKQSDQEAKSLTFLIALMAQLINQSSSDDIKAAAELKQKLSEAAARDAEKKAQDYEVEIRKAEEMQQVMGCVGKVMGWVIAIAGVAGALFTGGASLALAAVGLALTAADAIGEAITGRSFMQEALQPLMENIMQPLMEALGKGFADMLEACGVDKETASTVGQIMGGIAAAVLLVAGAALASGAIAKVTDVVVKAVGKNIVNKSITQRLINSAIGRMARNAGKGVKGLVKHDDIKMMKFFRGIQMAEYGTSAVNTAIQAGGNIAVTNMRVGAAKSQAAMAKDAALQDLLNEMMNRAVDTFSQRMETMNTIVKNISVVAENQMQAGKYITRQMRSVAG